MNRIGQVFDAGDFEPGLLHHLARKRVEGRFAPLDDPTFLTYVVVTNPKKGDTGTSVAAPVYKDIMNFTLPRYSVPPSTKKPKTNPIEYKP